MYRRYLITGATGFLGRAVLSELRKRDPEAEIVALVLKGDPLAGTLPARVRRVEGDRGGGHAPPAGCFARGCFRQAPAPRTIPAARTSRPPAVGSTGSSRFSVP